MKKIILPVLVLSVISVAGISAFADTGWVPMSGKATWINKEAIMQALANNTYASLPDAVKAKITEEQFNQAREKYLAKTTKKMAQETWKNNTEKGEHKKWQGKWMENGMKNGTGPMHSEAVQKAIASGDYAAFREAMIAQIPTETELQKRVSAQKAHTVALTAIQTAIKNNDFTAFKKAHTDLRATITALNIEGKEFKAPDDTQMKKHFDKMVEQYKKDGTLPEKGMGQWEMGEMEND